MTERSIGGSLFERISDAATLSPRRKPKMVLLRSIMQNLQNILNTRSGSCYGAPELGLPDLNDEILFSSDFRYEIERRIHGCIERYEPRITEVAVNTTIPEELRFHIVALVNFEVMSDVMEFDIMLDDNQRYQVELPDGF